MNKTALELTPEQWKTYHPHINYSTDNNQEEERVKLAWEIARNIAQILKEKFAITKVIVFGSLVHRHWFNQRSDIDIAVENLPPEKFFTALNYISDITDEFEIDLVPLETCFPKLKKVIEMEGVEI
jgi:uncharacterized protein